MFWLILFLCVSLLTVVVIQAVTTVRFLSILKRPAQPAISVERYPPVAVVLCLRGSDPFLEQCLQALVDQDYPDFEVRIVVDGKDDPAWDIAQRFMAEELDCGVTAIALSRPSGTCSLKCSSIVQAIATLDESVEVVALLDADTVPHKTWLRELVDPMDDPQVAVTTGSRWYMPSRPSWGSLVRYVWNAAAANQMVCFNIAWGGSLAVKRSAIERVNLIDRWERALCEDTMLYTLLNQHGFRQVFVPSLMMVNRETCSIAGFYTWVIRQLLTARLYHPGWAGTLVHGSVATLAPLAATALAVVSCWHGDWVFAAWLMACLALLEISFVVLLLIAERTLSGLVSEERASPSWLTLMGLVKLPIAVVITQFVYPVALLQTIFLRRVEWRGVYYQIAGPWKVCLEQYVPYQVRHTDDAVQSL